MSTRCFPQWRYPADWPQISWRAMERAWHQCEECGAESGRLGGHLEGRFLPALPTGTDGMRVTWPKAGEWGWCGRPGRGREQHLEIIRAQLVVIPINGDPADTRNENLRCVCQRCRRLRERRLARTRSARRESAIGDLFEEARDG